MKATDNISKIEYIEDNYPVNKIRVSNVGMWMYLRNVIWNQLENNNIHNSKSTITNGIKAVKNYYWNYKNRNNDNNYILFTDTYEEVMVNNYPIDRLMYDVAEELQDNLSVVLNPMGTNHKNSTIYTNNKYMSSHYFTFGMPKKHNIKGKDVLDVIIDYLNICASSRFRGGNISSYFYIKAIAEELRGLAVEFDVPIFSVSRCNLFHILLYLIKRNEVDLVYKN